MRQVLQNLTLKDRYLFGAVMSDPNNCKPLLGLVMNTQIKSIELSPERIKNYQPAYEGVRFDVWTEESDNSHYKIQLHVMDTFSPLRARYYHSQMNVEMLQSDFDREELPITVVIIICDFDPFEQKKYKYTISSSCKEDSTITYPDDGTTIVLSTAGENNADEDPRLIKFLDYFHANLMDSKGEFEDDYVRKLQYAVSRIRTDKLMAIRYMQWQDLLADAHREGVEEGLEIARKEILENKRKKSLLKGVRESIKILLSNQGGLSDELSAKIDTENDLDTLNRWLLIAAQSDSLESFTKE